MKKLGCILLLLFLLPFNPVKANEIEITSDYVLLYNLNDDEIIYEINSEERVNIASLTKMMTALVAIENCDDLNEIVTIQSKHFEGLEGYSKAGFRVGDSVTVKDLLYGVLLPSGADACNAIAFHIGKDMNGFIDMMNQKAIELNLKNTHFDNPIGKDSVNNYSNAKDLSVLLKYALDNPIFKEIFCTKTYKIKDLNLTLNSTLIKYSKSFGINTDLILGSKTGYTSEAGYCLASIASIDNIDYLLIVLNADTNLKCNAILDSLKIYHHFSKNYGYQTILSKNEIIYQLPIKFGIEKNYQITSDNEIKCYLKNDFNPNKINIEYNGIDQLNYKIKKNEKLGTIKVSYEDKEITVFDVYLNQDIHYIDPYLILIIIVSSIILLYIKIKPN